MLLLLISRFCSTFLLCFFTSSLPFSRLFSITQNLQLSMVHCTWLGVALDTWLVTSSTVTSCRGSTRLACLNCHRVPRSQLHFNPEGDVLGTFQPSIFDVRQLLGSYCTLVILHKAGKKLFTSRYQMWPARTSFYPK
ncbi:hypothetical protein DL96DRAFT_1593991 [Flagelloscypha sp. PMI_526]|nr:hypothetical protein DL96DRAFT_1593991 [Flagelloscypha sp. PMI_526]